MSLVQRQMQPYSSRLSFFFNDTATTEIYTLSLHDALPIFQLFGRVARLRFEGGQLFLLLREVGDRKSTRLNSSHLRISYAVFCLKKTHRAARAGHLWPYLPPDAGGGPHRLALPPLLPADQPRTPQSTSPPGPLKILFFFNDGSPPETSPLPPPDALRL